jgi:phage terminase Nu1 subunit (DNA packaging protein)
MRKTKQNREIDPDARVEIGTDTLGKILGVSPVEIGRLGSQGVTLRLGHNSFDLWTSVRQYVVWLRQRIKDNRSAPAEHTLDLASEKIRETRERADEIALDNARARGEFVPIDEIVEALETFCAAARQRVLGSTLLQEERDRLLNDLVGMLNAIATDYERNGNGTPAPGEPSSASAADQLPAMGGPVSLPVQGVVGAAG